MTIRIVEETPESLPEYEKVPIAFHVESRLRVELIDSGLGGILLREEPVTPYIKDYDADERNRPNRWPLRWDITKWGLLAAFQDGERVGGAAIVWKTPEINLTESADDTCLWDIRVHPEYRGRGVGHHLFSHATVWARKRNCRRLMAETQNINVPACRFYARQGCKIGAVNRYAYAEGLDEVQLLWYLEL
jgi:GNAT superfamily N-acetyltransferase